ncbi:hypothetical protein ACQP2X_23330 [Actinoplanes sp. CA-131856]
MSETLAAIAVVISLVALAVAWWNGNSARRSADAAEGSQHAADRSADAALRVADLESQRRHAETRPLYKMEILPGEDPIFEYSVWLTLIEHGPVQDLVVEVLSPNCTCCREGRRSARSSRSTSPLTSNSETPADAMHRRRPRRPLSNRDCLV